MQKEQVEVRRFKITRNHKISEQDLVVVEEPLQIDISQNEVHTTFSMTMRTPGDDPFLAYGLLFTEGVIASAEDIISVEMLEIAGEIEANGILLGIAENVQLDLGDKYRRITSYSGCGICGKTSIKALALKNNRELKPSHFEINISDIQRIRTLLAKQKLFSETGGSHVAGIIYENNSNGQASLDFENAKLFEDVGRHNALDKLIGYELVEHQLSEPGVIVLSGRIGFELVQKIVMSGFSTLVALGAPSNLAIQTANQFGVTLIGFAKNDQFNRYTF